MPREKDLKRLARQRMAKTGESYTTARAQILAKRSVAGEALTEPELAELAGISTAAVTKATREDWGSWLERLNAAGLGKSPHRAITRHLEEAYDISSWWVQSVAVGYERIVGLREVGQSCDGDFVANKSKTLPVPVAELFRAFDDPAQRERWLPDEEWSVRTSTPNRSLRFDGSDGRPVELWFVAKGERKSSVQVQHRKLASKDEIERVKAEWAERLDALTRFLVPGA